MGNPRSSTSLKNFVGQRDIVSLLQDEVDASIAQQTPLPSIVLQGPPGTGKTSLVAALAASRGVQVQVLMGAQLTETMLCAAIVAADASGHDEKGFVVDRSKTKPSIILIEEADGGSNRDVFEILHDILEPRPDGRRIFLAKQPGSTVRKKAWCPEVSVVMNTNFLGKLRKKAPAALNRCTVLQVGPYSEDELAILIQQYADSKAINIDEDAIQMIAERGMGIPRTAKRLFDRVNTRFTALIHRGNKRLKCITPAIVTQAFEQLKIDDLGLEPGPRQYLMALGQDPAGKMGAAAMASTIGVDTETLTVDIEPFLLRLGLVKIVGGGRQITEKGLLHVGFANANPMFGRMLNSTDV